MHWCTKEYKLQEGDTEFEDAYITLSNKRIRIDNLKGKSDVWYMGKGVEDGTAERLAKSYPKWKYKLSD